MPRRKAAKSPREQMRETHSRVAMVAGQISMCLESGKMSRSWVRGWIEDLRLAKDHLERIVADDKD